MNAQDFLTYAFDLIFFGYLALMLLDLIDRIGGELWEIFWPEQNTTSKEDDMPRTKMQHVSPGQLSLFDIKPEPRPQLPDPWTLSDGDAAEFIPLPHKPAQAEPKPLLLLPQAKEVSAQPHSPVTTEPTLDELLAGVSLDALQLRPARKIAKALGVAQKVNGKDQPLSWLRAQIKAKLQQPQSLPPGALEAMLSELAS